MLKIGKVHDYVIEGFSSNILIIYGFVGYLHSDDICVTRPVAFNIHDKSCTDLRIIEIKPCWIELNWIELNWIEWMNKWKFIFS